MSHKKPLLIVFFTVFVDLLGFGILIPVIPELLANPQSPFFLLHNHSLSEGYILLGFLTAVYPLSVFFAAPILGQLSDRFGRKKLLALSLAGTSASYVIFAIGIITRNIPLLFASRILDGITGGNIAIAQAVIADSTAPENRAKNFGIIGAAFGLGFIFGPYIGGKLSDPTVLHWFNATTPFWFAACLAMVNTISVIIFLPETNRLLQLGKKITPIQSIHNLIRAFSNIDVRALFIATFLFQAGFSFFATFSSVFLINRFQFTQGNIGDYFAYIGLWVAFTQAFIVRRFPKSVPPHLILRYGMLVTAFGLLLYFFVGNAWELLLVTPIFAIANGLTQVNLVGLISRSAGSTIQGEILGVNSSVQSLAQLIPPMLSGYIAASISPESPVLISVIVIGLAGLTFWLIYKPSNNSVYYK